MNSYFLTGLIIFSIGIWTLSYGASSTGYQSGLEAAGRPANETMPDPRFIVREDAGFGGEW